MVVQPPPGAGSARPQATRPAQEIAAQAEAVEAGTLSARITAHAEVAEYRRLVGVLNAMLDRLDRAFQAQRRFVADASHELRPPLTVRQGDLDVARRRVDDVDCPACAADHRTDLARTHPR